MKPSVYVETSVVSYLTARPSRDLVTATHQQITRYWWKNVLPLCEGFVSAVVLEEAAQGDPSAAQRRFDKLSQFTYGFASVTRNPGIGRSLFYRFGDS